MCLVVREVRLLVIAREWSCFLRALTSARVTVYDALYSYAHMTEKQTRNRRRRLTHTAAVFMCPGSVIAQLLSDNIPKTNTKQAAKTYPYSCWCAHVT